MSFPVLRFLTAVREALTPLVREAQRIGASCKWCGRRLSFVPPERNWWTARYCSSECGQKGSDADIAAEKALADELDHIDEHFED